VAGREKGFSGDVIPVVSTNDGRRRPVGRDALTPGESVPWCPCHELLQLWLAVVVESYQEW